MRSEEAELSARLRKLINYPGRFDPESSEPLVPGVDLDPPEPGAAAHPVLGNELVPEGAGPTDHEGHQQGRAGDSNGNAVSRAPDAGGASGTNPASSRQLELVRDRNSVPMALAASRTVEVYVMGNRIPSSAYTQSRCPRASSRRCWRRRSSRCSVNDALLRGLG